MSSVSSVNPGVSNVLQALTAVNSPILHSQSVVSALNSAPVSDIVQLSAEASRLANINTLFGISTSSSNSNMSSLLRALENASNTATTGATAPSVLGNATPSAQAANAQAAMQAELARGLFGASSSTGSIFSTLA